jgi:Tol biopolymer transport system component
MTGTESRQLPPTPHIEHLRKEAKQRFVLLKQKATGTRLADAQYWLARDYGFSNWRALKEEVLRRMGMVCMVPAPTSRHRRFQPPPTSADEEMEADFCFMRGAAVMGIGVIAALVIVAYVVLMIFSGRALGQDQQHVAIAMEPAQFDKYVGFYQLGPKAVLAVSRNGDHFFAGAAGQQQAEIFPESQTSFFLKITPAEISFVLDPQGTVTGAVLHQGGQERTLPRIDEAQAKAIAAAPHGHPMPVTWQTKIATPRILTTSSGLDYWPCFSPNGKTVLFSRSSDNGRTWSLFSVATAGGDTKPFASLPVSATRAAWSPGGQIAFTGSAADHSDAIWLINGDGSNAHAVQTDVSKHLLYPSWYPDGKSLAAMDGQTMTIRQIELSGNALTLTDRAQVMSGMSSVSPDGQWVAFAGQKNAGQSYDQEENVVWLRDRSGRLSTLETPPLQGRAPVWSPDGKQLAFESDRGNAKGDYAIFLINHDGSGLTQLTDFSLEATHPVFSADGKHLVMAYGIPGKANGIAMIDLSP